MLISIKIRLLVFSFFIVRRKKKRRKLLKKLFEALSIHTFSVSVREGFHQKKESFYFFIRMSILFLFIHHDSTGSSFLSIHSGHLVCSE